MKVIHLVAIIATVGMSATLLMRHVFTGNSLSVTDKTELCDCPYSALSENEPEDVSHPTDPPMKPSTFLLVMIPIRPQSFSKRELIRNTWYRGYKDSEDVMLRFITGVRDVSVNMTSKLKEENSVYDDVVLIDFHEGSQALTNKTIALMKWASDNVEFTYLMKCDDDTFVYVDNTITELKRRPTTTRLYYGRIEYNSPVIRDTRFKWADPKWDLGRSYMPYAIGGAYILSSDLVNMLAEQADYLKWHPNEDTAVGSWLVPYVYERRSDHLLCVTGQNKRLKYGCKQYFPLFHIFYAYPNGYNETTYFHLLHNEYLSANKNTGSQSQ